jgi:hypothetical protein
MTWFAHDVPSQQQIARLFDLFLSSHPLMPLYLAAVAIKASSRAAVHGAGTGAGAGAGQSILHLLLSKVELIGHCTGGCQPNAALG